jgi:hypothetical protein
MALGTQSVAATSTSVVARDSSRSMLVLMNASDEDIFLGFDQAAVLNSGIGLPPDGDPLVISVHGPLGALVGCAVNAICASGSKNLAYEAR